ncbi:hypothetical protein PACTADRAFT_36955 [Pachysolen tannophilus NRRL Y-2460]|uniref:Bromo domain-containing protein n=1 Tax=Pachysolen tannophilus NRRL Y-2460 TaxID=669874 RepID=A0A1E4U349_PACTA|nr:hypothetical protein PACTADRAFT_36955 [Pachysolen tannophilus NRRL Y-2460]
MFDELLPDDDEDEEDEEEKEEQKKENIKVEDDYQDDYNEDDDEDEMKDSKGSRKNVTLNYKNRRGRKRRIDDDDDDDASFHSENEDEDEDDDDDNLSSTEVEAEERKKIKTFIASDDDDDDDDDEEGEGVTRRARRNGRKRKEKNGRKRPKRTRRENRNDDDDEVDDDSEHLTLADELRDLKSFSPPHTPPHRKFNFRQRKEVNYQIPPPILNDVELEREFTTPKRGRKTGNSSVRNLLFPTVGPFGGSDVSSVFGENIPGLTAIAGNLSDSDSSDEDIIPFNNNNGNNVNNGIITNANNKKTLNTTGKVNTKSSLADSDPLGVDMNIDFSVVGGLDNYINQLKEMVVLPLLYPEVFSKFGITPPRGVLFHGPPGTGKTLMARALAASCSTENTKITFFMRKGADCLSKWVGEAERQLRLLFEEAKNQQPSIIFFDEIDGLAPVRSSKQEQIHASIVSTLLALMDGMDNRGQVIVIGATNRPDSVDPALRRPGRFDREFYFPLPDLKARTQILKIHTRNWKPALDEAFLDELAHLTKGYGGADLRALCTEAALNSIQRQYPQIYQTKEKLKINPERIKIVSKDFMMALDKIIPSSSRSISSLSSPLPQHIAPLLEDKFLDIVKRLNELIPSLSSSNKKLTSLEQAMYVDMTESDPDGGFKRQKLIKSLSTIRTFKPRILISAQPGSGQIYIGSAILNYLEGFHVQSLDLSNLFNDSSRSIESAIIQMFIEAKRHKPSVIYIPNVDIWYNAIPDASKSTLLSLLRSIQPHDKILLLGISDLDYRYLSKDLKDIFGLNNFIDLQIKLSQPKLEKFFDQLWIALHLKPFEYIDDFENRPKRNLPKLKIVKGIRTNAYNHKTDITRNVTLKDLNKQEIKALEKHDMRLKNSLKLKLSGLMDLFQKRYKRFKKPTIDENLLGYLFDPAIVPVGVDLPYKKDNNMILEVATGHHFYNMDLDIIEERLWNGFYNEPKQFLRDIEMIYKDAITLNDRERLLRASEMFANAQVGVEEIATADFVKECKLMHAREIVRQNMYLEDQRKKQQQKQQNHPQESESKDENSNIDPISILEREESSPILSQNGDKLEVNVSSTSLKKDAENKEETNEAVLSDENQDKSNDHNDNNNRNGNQKHTKLVTNNSDAPVVSSSEEEEEIPSIPPDLLKKDLYIDSEKLETIKRKLVHLCIHNVVNIENLEQINSKLMDIIYEDRKLYDKAVTLDKLERCINEFDTFFASSSLSEDEEE